VVIDAPNPRLGIITTGKSYLDVRQAFDDLGIDDALAAEIGIRLYKVGMVWPLESEGVRRFAEGLEEILVVEEKRQLIEYQLKEELYNWREDVRPRVIGKFDEKGEWALPNGRWLLPASGRAVAGADRPRHRRPHRPALHLAAHPRAPGLAEAKEASALAGDPGGAHALLLPGLPAQHLDLRARGLPRAGRHRLPLHGAVDEPRHRHLFAHGRRRRGLDGPGALHRAAARFRQPRRRHLLPLRLAGDTRCGGRLQRLAPRRSKGVTYKILYNDAVAMTGGQPVDGNLTVPQIATQLHAEGVHHVVVVTDGTPRAYGHPDLPHGVPMRHRDELDAIQRDMRECPGVSAIIYDQTCAAEKRRRRKRGKMIDPPRRLFINEAVCEGCGDCGVQSNCLAVVPVETELGRKRAIDQSACNKDYSCEKGFCPSFVSVIGGSVRKGRGAAVPGRRPIPSPCRQRRLLRRRPRPTTSSSPASAAPAWSRSAP
jgi:indolepyruvate ferredoxin oxidoreductase